MKFINAYGYYQFKTEKDMTDFLNSFHVEKKDIIKIAAPYIFCNKWRIIIINKIPYAEEEQ